jgi:hypothetical protein
LEKLIPKRLRFSTTAQLVQQISHLADCFNTRIRPVMGQAYGFPKVFLGAGIIADLPGNPALLQRNDRRLSACLKIPCPLERFAIVPGFPKCPEQACPASLEADVPSQRRLEILFCSFVVS